MPIVRITLYRTEVIRGKVQADSQTVSLEIDDSNDNGLIEADEWQAFTGLHNSRVAGESFPAMLFHSTNDTGSNRTGILYSPVSHTAGTDLTKLLRDLDRKHFAPSLDDLNICYLAGTMIATPSGEVPVEALRAGDLVLTRDHGAQALVWTSSSHVTPADLDLAPNRRPVRIAAGALGQGLPRRDVDVSPQHRILVRDSEGGEYLISARHLIMSGHPGVALRPLGGEFDLVHIAFADHEIIMAEGAAMESFFTGPQAVRALALPQRMGLILSFPDLARGENPMHPARPFIKHRDYARMRGQLPASVDGSA
ncbi:Hint domain-containing protein [Paracoccus marinaquae]|uniref:Hint domain-containing protein n=1 Tax=Paracoccus marinaquae TaxID=2841926 RepID=A0ABS6AIA8_9RHOB|nr:Hint domain-containing protein [Paracoccus marinaquae]MBU3030335.1 Hint domain-containing protein [Paracoccus marinaquae]